MDLYWWAVHAGQRTVKQVLNVEAPYLLRSQAFIFSLFSGEHGNGSSAGCSGGLYAVGRST